MRAKLVNEENFERGQDPKFAMDIGLVQKILKETQDAYSFDAYGPDNWRNVIKASNIIKTIIVLPGNAIHFISLLRLIIQTSQSKLPCRECMDNLWRQHQNSNHHYHKAVDCS